MTPDDIDWEYDPAQTPGGNVRAMLRAADAAGYTAADCKTFAARYIPGAGPTIVVRNIDACDVSLAKHSLAEYM